MHCYCDSWHEFEKIENSERSYLFVHGIVYSGPKFVYCPFCGSTLQTAEAITAHIKKVVDK